MPFLDNASDSLPNYIVRVKTGAQTPSHADETDALSIVLLDSSSDSSRTVLQQQIHPSARSLLQAGQEDRFEMTIPSMQEVRTLLLLVNPPDKVSTF